METRAGDRLTRALATTATHRRRVVQAIGARIGAGVLARLVPAQPAAAKTCKQLGKACSGPDQCCGKLLCKNANSQTSCFPSTQRRCCKKIGARCNSSCECCGVDVICNGHVCQQA